MIELASSQKVYTSDIPFTRLLFDSNFVSITDMLASRYLGLLRKQLLERYKARTRPIYDTVFKNERALTAMCPR